MQISRGFQVVSIAFQAVFKDFKDGLGRFMGFKWWCRNHPSQCSRNEGFKRIPEAFQGISGRLRSIQKGLRDVTALYESFKRGSIYSPHSTHNHSSLLMWIEKNNKRCVPNEPFNFLEVLRNAPETLRKSVTYNIFAHIIWNTNMYVFKGFWSLSKAFQGVLGAFHGRFNGITEVSVAFRSISGQRRTRRILGTPLHQRGFKGIMEVQGAF